MIFDIRKCFLQMIGIVLLLLAVTMLGRAQDKWQLTSDVILTHTEFEIKGCPAGYELAGYLYSNPIRYLCRNRVRSLALPTDNVTIRTLAQTPIQSYIVDNEGNVSLYRKEANSPLLTEDYRAEVERRFQAEYEKLIPGVKVELYARNSQYILLFKVTGQSDVIYQMNVEDIDNPKVLAKGIFLKMNSARLKKLFRR